MSHDKGAKEAELHHAKAQALATKLGMTSTVSYVDSLGAVHTNHATPIVDGLAVSLSNCGRKAKGDLHHTVFGLTVVHHSNSTITRSYAWPPTKKGLRAALACRDALLELPFDWTRDPNDLGINDTNRSLPLGVFDAHFDQFGVEHLVLWQGRPIVDAPTTTVRVYVATEYWWEVFTCELGEDADLHAMLAEGAADHRTNKSHLASFGRFDRVTHLGRTTADTLWAEHGVTGLTSTPARLAIGSHTTALDYGLVDTHRGPERVLVVLPSAGNVTWPELADHLLAMLPEVEWAKVAARQAHDWAKLYGTWASGARAGTVRWPGRMPKAERAQHEAEQRAGNAARAHLDRLQERLRVVVEDVESVTDHPSIPDYLDRLLEVRHRVHEALPYRHPADFRRYVERLAFRETAARLAREAEPSSVTRYGLNIDDRCRVLPAPWDMPAVERTGVVVRVKVVSTTTYIGKMPIVEHWRRVRVDGPDPEHLDAVVAVEEDWSDGEDLLRAYRRCVPI